MIKFFRKIRQKLLSENKFSKYLLYALGEIILVVMGILMALQINNWKQKQENLKKVNKYLTEIKQNIKADIHRIDELDRFNIQKSKSLKQAISHYYNLEQDLKYKDTISALIVSGEISRTGSFRVSTHGIEALLGSGEINLIADSIRIKINSYYEQVNRITSTNNRIVSLTRETIQDKLVKQVFDRAMIAHLANVDIAQSNYEGNPKFMVNNDIPNDLLFLSTIINFHIEALAQIKIKGLDIIKEIDEEITSNQ